MIEHFGALFMHFLFLFRALQIDVYYISFPILMESLWAEEGSYHHVQCISQGLDTKRNHSVLQVEKI